MEVKGISKIQNMGCLKESDFDSDAWWHICYEWKVADLITAEVHEDLEQLRD